MGSEWAYQFFRLVERMRDKQNKYGFVTEYGGLNL